MLGDLYIGRGSRQRSLKKSLWCNPFKVSEYGRELAVSKCDHHLRTNQDLNDALWQLSGARLVCHCRPGESCHADIIRKVFSEKFPDAHDRDNEEMEPPTAQVLNYMAKLREVPEQSDGSSADEGAPERGAGWVGHGPPIKVGVGYVSRELCDANLWLRRGDRHQSSAGTRSTNSGAQWSDSSRTSPTHTEQKDC